MKWYWLLYPSMNNNSRAGELWVRKAMRSGSLYSPFTEKLLCSTRVWGKSLKILMARWRAIHCLKWSFSACSIQAELLSSYQLFCNSTRRSNAGNWGKWGVIAKKEKKQSINTYQNMKLDLKARDGSWRVCDLFEQVRKALAQHQSTSIHTTDQKGRLEKASWGCMPSQTNLLFLSFPPPPNVWKNE